jgi:hypothetical protein
VKPRKGLYHERTELNFNRHDGATSQNGLQRFPSPSNPMMASGNTSSYMKVLEVSTF